MSTTLLIQQIRYHWWAWLFVVCVVSYFIYSFIKEYFELKTVKDRKKGFEEDLAKLEVKYSEQAKKLEEKAEGFKKFHKGGQK
jgi:hypothetical protein